MITGFSIGIVPIIWGLIKHFAMDWALEYSMFSGSQFNYWGSLFIAAGYLGLIMWVIKSGLMKKTTVALAAVGRMAFSNYLLQTLICTTLFYGHGFGLFGQVERFGQILIVIALLLLQLIISPIWLSYFHFGPMEWLWRSLTYWKIQPMRRA